jgi:hypothetical protein
MVAVALPGTSGETIHVTLSAHHERNPASQASQIWLWNLSIIPPAEVATASLALVPVP